MSGNEKELCTFIGFAIAAAFLATSVLKYKLAIRQAYSGKSASLLDAELPRVPKKRRKSGVAVKEKN